MSGEFFLDWMRRFLLGQGRLSVSFEGLSPDEVDVAKQIEKECRKADSIEQYSKVFLQTLDSREQFSDNIIGVLSALVKIGSLGEQSRSDNSFCRHLAEIFTDELGFESCSVLLKNPNTGRLWLIAASAREDKYLKTPGRVKTQSKAVLSPAVRDIAGLVAGSGEHIHIPDISADSRFSGAACTGNGSLISAPLKSGTDILGVINCCHPVPRVFDENGVPVVLLLSNFSGQVISLIRLRKMMSEWNKTLENEVRKKTAELQKKNAKLHKLAVTDSLTNLYNRRFLFTRLEEEFSRALRYNEEFVLLLIDIDNLKTINDNYGHMAGDKVIRDISRCLKTSVRKGDVIGRLGGDEFGYIMVNADVEAACRFSSRLQESLAGVAFREMDIKPTLSIGIAAVGMGNFTKSRDIYKAADDALYTAKKKKNCITVFKKTLKRKPGTKQNN